MVRDIEHQHQSEFSRLVATARVGDTAIVEEIAATEHERAALVERFGWVSMQRLTATVRLRRLKRDLIRASGHYEADLEQACVVTLEPVPAHVEGEFNQLYLEGGEPEQEDAVVAVSVTEEEPPESVVGGKIDIGEAVVQQIAVALDPYPRAPGAALPEAVDWPPAGEEEGQAGPFAVLAELTKARRKEG